MKLPFVQMEPELGKRLPRNPDEPLRIGYFAMDLGGCTFYRAMQPLDLLHTQKLASVMRIEKGDTPDRIAEALAGGEVIVQPRLAAGDKMLKTMGTLKEDGKLVVVDYDDNIWNVSPLSPHYGDYGLKEFNVHHPNTGVLALWKDGKGFSIAQNKEKLEAVERALAAASLVTTTTPILADVLRKFNPNVEVLPNCVDLTRWRKLPMVPHDPEIRLFWAGGSSHYEDLLVIEPVLPIIMEKYPNVKLITMGVKFPGIVKRLPAGRVEFYDWEPNTSYPLRCATLAADLAVIPLQDNEFNRCKSPIKWIEQAALEVPCICSNVSPYKEIYNGHNAAMVNDNDPDAWVAALETLIEQESLRRVIAEEGRKYVEEHFDISKQAVRWLEVYKKHLPSVEEPCLSLSSAI